VSASTNALLIVLDEGLHEDAVQAIADAIGQVRHVVNVQRHEPSLNLEVHIAKQRLLTDLLPKLIKVVQDAR
jgi:hypothetical protein